jgi:DNA (cytosine-5)-methyltransferase 1
MNTPPIALPQTAPETQVSGRRLVSPPITGLGAATEDVIDLFGGWGGMSLGAVLAGARVVWAGNHWPLAVQTHTMNHPDTEHACQDLRQQDWTALPKYSVMLGAPACQGHSTASQSRRRLYHDAMRASAWAIVECADVTEPKAIVVENVPAFLRWRLFPEFVSSLERLGYDVEARLVVASRVVPRSGRRVAQRRPRVFLLATRRGVHVRPLVEDRIEIPFGPLLDERTEHTWREVAKASPGVQLRIERSRVRHGARFLTQHTTDHHGVPLHEPIRTITTAPAHWNLVDGDRYRALSGRELARGMGFPDSFTWPADATVADVTEGIGNAVCPPVAEAVVEAVLEAVA